MLPLPGAQLEIVSGLQRWLIWGSTLSVGCAVAWFAANLLAVAGRKLPADLPSHDFEGCRRIRLRRGSVLYRWFEPLVDELCGFRPLFWLSNPRRVAVGLTRSASPLPWTAEEFLAVQALGGLSLGAVAVVLFQVKGSVQSQFLYALAATVLYITIAARALQQRGIKRLNRLKHRLPFAMDLIALTMEAGGTFRESLRTVVDETRGQPLGDEFAAVLGQISRGQTLRDALAQLHERLADDDIQEIVRNGQERRGNGHSHEHYVPRPGRADATAALATGRDADRQVADDDGLSRPDHHGGLHAGGPRTVRVERLALVPETHS